MNEYDKNSDGRGVNPTANAAYDANWNSEAGAGQSANNRVQPVPIFSFGGLSKSPTVTTPSIANKHSLSNMLDVPLTLVFEVGRRSITIAHLMELREGSYINLRNVSVDVIDVRVNDHIIAEAEAISLQQRYGMRISEVVKMPGADEGQNDV